MSAHHYIACDLGAESVRVMLGTLADGKITIEEIHRSPNSPVRIAGSLRWDVVRLFEELKTGLRKVSRRGISPDSLSCDSWGVDYVLLRGQEPLWTLPFHYRDARTDGALERAFRILPADQIFAETGIQILFINTLYQLLADLYTRREIVEGADRFLNIGDYFNFLFSGVAKAETSLASTTQLYNPQSRAWSRKLIEQFNLPGKIFPEIVPSGTLLGPLLPEIQEETGLRDINVIAGCSHDTAAAVAAVPAKETQWAYLSSGTWSLLGVERPSPVINEQSRQYQFTNEVGYGGSIRLLKNIAGLWLMQECRRAWAEEGMQFTYEALTEMAEATGSASSVINPMDPVFVRPGNMPQKIIDACRSNEQPIPKTPGEIVRCVLESLALSYRRALDQLEELTGETIITLHIVGGGCKNRLLNQLTANATRRTVLAGPVECSAIGNVLVQARALGHLPSLQAGREVVHKSFRLVRYEPSQNQGLPPTSR